MPKGKGHDYYVKKAEEAKCRIKEGREHTLIFPPEGQYPENEYPFMSIPRHKKLSPGVESKLIKFLKALGVLIVLLIILYVLI